MFIRRQDLSVLFLYFLGYSRIRNWVLRLQRRAVTRFVTFHDIPPEGLGRFAAKLLFLKRKTNVVSLDDFYSGRLSVDKINIVITFDDGYKSWVTYAVPILKNLELPATFFISSSFVGYNTENAAEFMRSKLLSTQYPGRIMGGLTFEDFRMIVEEGFTVGGHTLNHSNLTMIRDHAQLRYEISEDKIRLERITGSKIKYFAYPFGAYQNPEINVTDILKESGYIAAVTTVSGLNIPGFNPYLLYREITGATMLGPVFKARVYGNYDAVLFFKQQVSKILSWRSERNAKGSAH